MGRPKASDVAASAAQRLHQRATVPHEEDQTTVAPSGRSWVYGYYNHRKDSNDVVQKDTYYCSRCVPGTRGSTDNPSGIIKLKSAALNPLARHLKAAHGIEGPGGPGEEGKNSPAPSAVSPGHIQAYSRLPKKINEDLLDSFARELLIRDLEPFNMCEHEGFRTFCQELNPRFQLCSRRKMSSKVVERVLTSFEEETVKLIQEAVKETNTVIHWAGDLWSADYTQQQHLAHMLQFCTVDFRLVTLCVSMEPFDKSKTADNQRRAINQVMEA
ncbi:unnamed protein product, partial [Symbiodinium microadriaticum]